MLKYKKCEGIHFDIILYISENVFHSKIKKLCKRKTNFSSREQ